MLDRKPQQKQANDHHHQAAGASPESFPRSAHGLRWHRRRRKKRRRKELVAAGEIAKAGSSGAGDGEAQEISRLPTIARAASERDQMLEKIRSGLIRRWPNARALVCYCMPLLRWLCVPVILVVTVLLVPVLVPAACDEAIFRWAGMILQFCGLLAVVKGLNDTRKQFGRSSIRSMVWSMVRGFVARTRDIVAPPSPVAKSGQAKLSGGGKITVSALAPTVSVTKSLDDRVKVLEEALRGVKGSQAAIEEKMVQTQQQIREQVGREAAERAAGDQGTVKLLEAVTIGGLKLELTGVTLLFLGIALTSVPSELAGLCLP